MADVRSLRLIDTCLKTAPGQTVARCRLESPTHEENDAVEQTAGSVKSEPHSLPKHVTNSNSCPRLLPLSFHVWTWHRFGFKCPEAHGFSSLGRPGFDWQLACGPYESERHFEGDLKAKACCDELSHDLFGRNPNPWKVSHGTVPFAEAAKQRRPAVHFTARPGTDQLADRWRLGQIAFSLPGQCKGSAMCGLDVAFMFFVCLFVCVCITLTVCCPVAWHQSCP